MSDLRNRITEKIFNADPAIDLTCDDSAIIVFLGDAANKNLKKHMDACLQSALNKQLKDGRITEVLILTQEDFLRLNQKIKSAISSMKFAVGTTNRLFISFVTVMDDEIYQNSHFDLDISGLEEIKEDLFFGIGMVFEYTFYGLFLPKISQQCRLNARQTIVEFLSSNQDVPKKVYHHVCHDYYRSAKAISFVILTTLIDKLHLHGVAYSSVDNENYSWNTFEFFEQNLPANLICQAVFKLLDKQGDPNYVEDLSADIVKHLSDTLEAIGRDLASIVDSREINYVPILMFKSQYKLSFFQKIFKTLFRKNYDTTIYVKSYDDDSSIVSNLIAQQAAVCDAYIKEKVTDAYKTNFIAEIFSMYTTWKGVEGFLSIDTAFAQVIETLEYKRDNRINEALSEDAEYLSEYHKMFCNKKIQIARLLNSYCRENMEVLYKTYQKTWSDMRVETNNYLSTMAKFDSEKIIVDNLMKDKSAHLTCSYDDILNEIHMKDILQNIGDGILLDVLKNYFPQVKEAGKLAYTYGNLLIYPSHCTYTLYLDKPLNHKIDDLEVCSDDYWFRNSEISILMTTINKSSDCTLLYSKKGNVL